MIPAGASLASLAPAPAASGSPSVPVAFGVAIALALTAMALTARTPGARAGRWFALLLSGSAATLQLTAAGTLIRYQHFLPQSLGLTGRGRWALAVLVIQAVVVALAIRPEAAGIIRWIAARWSGTRGALLVALFAGTSATLSAAPAAYGLELVLATAGQLLQLATLVLGLAALPPAWSAAAARWCTPGPGKRDAVPLYLAGAATLVAAVLAVLAYQRHPHVPDEVVYLLQARTFASGALTLPVPPVLAAFDLDITLSDAGRWYSAFPPGWPAVLALGSLVNLEWLVNPLLGGVNVLLAYGIARRLYDQRTARLTALLLAASPWHLFLAMSYMSQTVTLTVALAGGLGVARWREGAGPGWLVLAGAAAGYAGLTRPLDGLLVAAALGLWLIWPGPSVSSHAKRAVGAVAFGLGLGLTGALTLLYNRALTGHPLTFPVMLWSDRVFGPGTNALGFGPTRGFGWNTLDPFPGHGWRDVLVNANLNSFQVNVELLGWGTGSLLLVLALLFRGRLDRRDLGLFLAAALVVVLHAFYWFSGGPDFGARYWFLVIFPLIALAARGALALDAEIAPTGRVLAGVLALALVTLIAFVPWRAGDKYHHYRRMRPDLRALADSAGFGRSLVLVQGRRFPDYAGAAPYNPLDLRADQPIYALDRDSTTRRALLAAYPDRPRWVVAGPSVTGGAYRIIAGPLAPDASLPPPPPE